MVAQNDNDTKAVSPVIGVILMVAITVILAAVIGTFVLGLGEGVEENARAGFTIDQEPGTSVTVKINSLGNLESFGLLGPDGQPTLLSLERTTLNTGTRYEISDAGFSNEELNNEFPTPVGPVQLPSEAYGECRIVHGSDTIELGGDEVFIGGADLPCTATNSSITPPPLAPLADLSSDNDFGYEEGAEYKIVGSVEGKEQGRVVIQTFETEEG